MSGIYCDVTRSTLLRECRKQGVEWRAYKLGSRYRWPWHRMQEGDSLVVYGALFVKAMRKQVAKMNYEARHKVWATETIYTESGEPAAIATKMTEEMQLRYAGSGGRTRVRRLITETKNGTLAPRKVKIRKRRVRRQRKQEDAL